MDESLSSNLFMMRCMSVPTLESFKWRLAETIAWYGYKKTLRSDELMPEWYTESSMSEHSLAQDVYKLSFVERIEVVENLASKRASFLESKGSYPASSAESLSNGKLFVHDFDGNASDGASAGASNFFLDNDNVPPWDLWLFYVPSEVLDKDPAFSYSWTLSSFLIAWIPSEYLNIVESGLRVHAEGCIAWADYLDSSFIQTLRDAGFVQNSKSL